MRISQALGWGCLVTLTIIGLWEYHSNPSIFQLSNLLNPPVTAPSIKRIIHTPSPLHHSEQPDRPASLTLEGILAATNNHRKEQGLPPLQENSLLNAAAQQKVEDMFTQQYFEHESPDGRGPADVVEAAGYSYITVGENLALGSFESDNALVQAWMDSPGHRANILSDKFQELGIAVGEGEFKGNKTWLAVQTFGTPLSNCPPPDASLHTTFEQERQSARLLQTQLNTQKEELDAQISTVRSRFSEAQDLANQGTILVDQGNTNIQKGNNIYEETGSEEKARPYWDQGKDQQKKGKDLLAQAQSKQDEAVREGEILENLQHEYNKTVDQYNAASVKTGNNAKTYNEEVRAFNKCVERYQ